MYYNGSASPGLHYAVAVALLATSAALLSSTKPAFTPQEKAYYADARLVNFVRPGLVIKIVSAEIAQDGLIRARLKLSDPKGLPLDREGVTTPGAVLISLVAAYIPRNQTQYVAYTTRTQTSPITNASAVQASSDTGGAWERAAEGEYIYTFQTRAPASRDRAATHTIGAYGSRDLSEFDLGIQYDDDVYSFVPEGSKVSQVRDVVRTVTCNRCHDPLAVHGGRRRSVELCVLCHTPQTTDPDTKNTVDMPVMIHKIHMGASLPSVKAGKKYQIIGFQQSVADYSTVIFPADARNCRACHDPAAGAVQADNVFKPSRAACGACHDDVNFSTGDRHLDLPQVSDSQCGTCHTREGELEFDASILGAHTIPIRARSLPGTVFTIERVDDGVAGKQPTVTFTVKDKSGKPILPSEMGLLTLVLAGAAPDYTMTTDLAEDARSAQGGGDGRYVYTFKTPIPADARGTFAIGIHGFRTVKLLEGTKKEQSVRDAGPNKVVYFVVDGSQVNPRRKVVAIEKCNACHGYIQKHSRFKPADQIEHCTLCHLTTFTDKDAAFRPANAGPPQSLSLGFMIHRIHTGKELTREYSTYGTTSIHKFNGIRYPGDRRDCQACHVSGSEQLPLPDNLRSVTTPAEFMNPTPPASAACLGCHDTRAAASHALANTTTIGESCAACHGSNAAFSVNRIHAR
ncbi:MAG: OmcA/MtrC family decaheme c-type cytochrome [Acidobacteria bacterium]|nr:OmcA/MtrC family decaheme c-type cytochrome [Acidobacteriota bacterium]